MTILHIEHSVLDYDGWKATFDNDPLGRKKSGVRRYRIARAADTPNLVMIDLEFETRAEAEKLLASLHELWSRLEGTLIQGPTGRIFDVTEAQET